MKASRTPVRPATTAAGSAGPSRASGAGWSQGTDGSRGARVTRWSSDGGPSPEGRGRRERAVSAVRQVRVAIV